MIMRSAVGRVALASLLFLSGLAPVGSCAYAEEGIDVSVRLEDASASHSEIKLGDHIGRSFVITPVCDECFVRLRAWLCLEEISEQVDYSPPKEEGWFLANDGWWYQTEPTQRGESISFTSDFVIDGSESFIDRNFARQERRTTDISEVVTASVIQAQAVNPDWTSDDPWRLSAPGGNQPSDNPDSGDGDSTQGGISGENRPSDDQGSANLSGEANDTGDTALDSGSGVEAPVSTSLPNTLSKNEGSLLPKEQTITIGSLPQTDDDEMLLNLLIVSVFFSIVILRTASVLMRGKPHTKHRVGEICIRTT